jgi:hypothetical protein
LIEGEEWGEIRTDGDGHPYMYELTSGHQFDAAELRAIADKLDELNGVSK